MSYRNYRQEHKKYTATNDIEDRDASKKMTSVTSFESMKEDWRKFCSFYRQYPDLFIDLISPPNSKVKLFFYQRMMLRILFRYQQVYFTMTRGSAKSFTQILGLYLKCVMYGDVHLFIAAPTKMQAAQISQENIERIWDFFPILKNEVKHDYFNKDSTKLIFHNGSKLDVVQVAQSARGGRRHGGSVEEIVDETMKKDVLNEVVIPMMANNRIAACGGSDPYEIHKSTAYVTTAGTRQSFAYEKQMEVLKMMLEGKSAFTLGSGYELPVMHNQLDLDYIVSLKESETFNPLGFSREYESNWTGSSDRSLVSFESINECRVLNKAEDKNMDKNAMYILSYDVARAEGLANANSALVVIKCIPRGNGTYSKHLVNIYSFEGTHFKEQAQFLKKKVNDFKASILVVDVNGLGSGLVDFLVLEIDENPPYSVVNDSRYDVYKTPNSIPMVFALNSGSKDTKASDIHNLFINLISNNGVKMLVSNSQARSQIKIKDSEKLVEELLPFTMTDLLVEEIMNLEYRQSGNDTQVKQVSKSIAKDKFSAFEYGLFYVHLEEKRNQTRRKQTFDPSKLLMIKPPKLY
ncbi:DNA-packaging protein [Siminovitchia sp. 179-K 8D1 HS]|uniref:DNA-packaging protein n=1 Tax=Siminovitchia sp. 179-K 8D1 HS TaxID=3142385 RepID=UPI0039A278C3